MQESIFAFDLVLRITRSEKQVFLFLLLQKQGKFGGSRKAGGGISLVSSVKEALKSHTIVFCCFRKVIHIFSTAEGLLTQNDKITPDGLQEVFETNVFGHFILVKQF